MQDFAMNAERSGELDVLERLGECLSRQFLYDVPDLYTTVPDPNAVYLVAAGANIPLSVIQLKDAAEYLPCFDEADVWYGVTDTSIVASYCPGQVTTVAGKKYLIGPILFFGMDKNFNTVSLTLGDLHDILKFLHDRKIVFEAGDEIFEAICLD